MLHPDSEGIQQRHKALENLEKSRGESNHISHFAL